MAKIPHQYSLLQEESKLKFQAHVSSLLEIQGFLKDKQRNARNKEAVFFSAHEMNTIDGWLTHVITGLMADYEILNRAGRLQEVNYSAVLQMLADCTGDNKKSA